MQQGEGDALGRGWGTGRGSRFLTLLTVGSGNKCSRVRGPRGSTGVPLASSPLPRGLWASRVAARAAQRDHEDRDVIAGAQLVVGQPPAPLLQHPPGPQHQLLGHHGVPGGRAQRSAAAPDPADSLTQHTAAPGKEAAGGARGAAKGPLEGRDPSSDTRIQGSTARCGAVPAPRPEGHVATTLLQGARKMP